jgi:hypothetical protein
VRTKEILRGCQNAASSTGFRLSQTHVSLPPADPRKAFIFRIMHPCRSTRWERPRGKSLLGRGKYLLFESFIASTVHIAARQQLSELSLQCIFGLLLVPHLLCARLIERLAFPAYLYLLQYITGSFILRRILFSERPDP